RRLEDLEARTATHLQVADDDIEEPFVELLNGRVAVGRFLDVMACFRDRLGESPAERIVVVSDQYPSHTSNPRCRPIPAASLELSCPDPRPSADRFVLRVRRQSSGRWPVPAPIPGASS